MDAAAMKNTGGRDQRITALEAQLERQIVERIAK